jgi:hypothetical protein
MTNCSMMSQKRKSLLSIRSEKSDTLEKKCTRGKNENKIILFAMWW